MTDRELLERAAKAAGIVGYWVDGFGFRVDDENGKHSFWNPLFDDGEALRLAVKCGLVVDVNEDIIFVGTANIDLNEAITKKLDMYAATRRAIVRAAAEIGKAMP